MIIPMLDFPLWFLLLGLPFGVFACAIEQHNKRKKEEARRQKELEARRADAEMIQRLKREWAELDERYGLTKKE